jgi:NADH-quinone oxidoreductase subunit J
MSINVLFYIFGFALCASALLAVLSKKPVHSVLYLVLSFFASAWVMLLLKAEFLAMLLIIIYVGAVAVLFLFVVMMLQTNYKESHSHWHKITGGILGLLIFLQIFGLLMFNDIKSQYYEIMPISLQDVSRDLYIVNFFNFQIVGLVLLIAMIGVLLITHSKSTTFARKQNIGKQVLRKKEDCITLVRPENGKGVTL